MNKRDPYSSVHIEKDEVTHTIWQVPESENSHFEYLTSKIECTYVADGHHRSAAAYNVGKYMRDEAIRNG